MGCLSSVFDNDEDEMSAWARKQKGTCNDVTLLCGKQCLYSRVNKVKSIISCIEVLAQPLRNALQYIQLDTASVHYTTRTSSQSVCLLLYFSAW